MGTSRIAIIGLGYVGLATAACLADLGHDVVGIDHDAAHVSRLSATDLDRAAAATAGAFEPDPARHERYAYRQVQFEAAHAALLPINEALSS